jgi:TRAP-type C4-dicarboxylate transport system permease small subunit
MIRRLFRRLDRLSEALAFIGMVLISIAIVALLVDIVGRKTIGFSILGISDIMQLLVMACICLAMPFAFVREGHVGVDFVTDGLPPRALAALKLAVALLSSAFVVVLMRYGLIQAGQQIAKGDMSMTLAIPIVWYWAPLLIALGVSALACLLHAARYLVALLSGRDPLRSRASTSAVN